MKGQSTCSPRVGERSTRSPSCRSTQRTYDARCVRAGPRLDLGGPRVCARGLPSGVRDVPARWWTPAWRASSPSSAPRSIHCGRRWPACSGPGDVGMPTEDDGSRTDPLLNESVITSTHYGLTSKPCARPRRGSWSPPARIQRRAREPRRLCRRRAAWYRADDLPERPWWFLWRRIRPDR